MQMTFCPLYSGSSGNASLVVYRDTRILVDCGKSGIQIDEAMRFVGEKAADLDAILVTHEHHDHVAGIGVMARRYKIPIYATHETWNAMPSGIGKIPDGLKREFVIGEDFYIRNLGIDSSVGRKPFGEHCDGSGIHVGESEELRFRKQPDSSGKQL